MISRCLIIAAGDGTRWGDYRGVPKHLVSIEGERLLDRTAYLFRPCVTVIGPKSDMRYRTPHALRADARLNPENGGADKFLSSAHLWGSEQDRTIILYGDVWFSKAAAERILSYETDEITFFGREKGSKHTGCRCGELFAVMIPDGQHRHALESLKELARLHKQKKSIRGGGWEWYKLLNGFPVEPAFHQIGKGFVEMSPSFTEDFDYPADLDLWEAKREEWLKENEGEPDDIGSEQRTKNEERREAE